MKITKSFLWPLTSLTVITQMFHNGILVQCEIHFLQLHSSYCLLLLLLFLFCFCFCFCFICFVFFETIETVWFQKQHVGLIIRVLGVKFRLCFLLITCASFFFSFVKQRKGKEGVVKWDNCKNNLHYSWYRMCNQ